MPYRRVRLRGPCNTVAAVSLVNQVGLCAGAAGADVFWIHHEEEEGVWRWEGRRNLTDFIWRAHTHGLRVLLRTGPWSHGECRGGGFPDWLLKKPGIVVRSDNSVYLSYVEKFMGQVAQQLRGAFWHENGPIDLVQLENEFGGPAEHLLTLRSMAEKHGMVPALYARTAWPDTSTPVR